MAEMDLRIFDFSGAFVQEGLGEAVSAIGGLSCIRLDCRAIEGTNCYCEDEAREAIAALLSGCPKTDGLGVNWIDTGDYHHVSRLTVEAAAAEGPLTLVLFDHHPDMQEPAFGGILSCGGWLRSLLEDCPGVVQAVILGINPELACECEGFGSRVVVHDRESIADFDPASLAGRRVYLSIDKDVLSPEWAGTDWDHGTMSLGTLLNTVRAISDLSHLAGADICGGITSAKGGRDADFVLNLAADMALLRLFSSLAKR